MLIWLFVWSVAFFSLVQFSVEPVADKAAAASRLLLLRGSSPETKGTNFTEQGKDTIQRSCKSSTEKNYVWLLLISFLYICAVLFLRLGFSGKKCTQLLFAREKKNPKLHFTLSSDWKEIHYITGKLMCHIFKSRKSHKVIILWI